MHFREKKTLLLLGDVVLMYAALAAMIWFRFDGWNQSQFLEHLLPFSFLYVLWVLALYVLGLYELSVLPSTQKFQARLMGVLVVLFSLGAAYFYLVSTPSITPKTNLLVHVALFGGLAIVWRHLFFRSLSKRRPWKFGIFGDPERARDLHGHISAHRHLGYESVTFKQLDETLAEKIDRYGLNVVVLPSMQEAESDTLTFLYESLPRGIVCMDYAQAYERFSRKIPVAFVDQRWFISHVADQQDGLYQQIKRMGDVLMAALIFLCTLPLWAFIALAIFLEDRGSIFYSQVRVGHRGVPFSIYKFRSMRQDAERHGAQWAQKNDQRVTRVGRFLRASHLDELPQLLNVMRGDISLVGPRPERPEFVSQLEGEISHYHVRHLIKPGFTGWAQINFRYARSVMDSREKFEYDLYYIKNHSLALDVLILMKTIRLVLPKTSV